ncbi:Uncharacterised protein [Legionella londiniensis]|uniref:Uncharacterized protein n=2 Tax=Legionella londiniensis TaxID=45068 RepID=A0A0W0VII6_9GAMM|nr:hypothetical protein [Legionella londiniensis]KTD19936.1 hypothetical protein Llon_2108 [Legionella londiniensis]STX94191.1 Uncharacterised protein [Legionella londiniensis]
MNKRLVWNFEIHSSPELRLPRQPELTDEMKWEIRFFWPADAIIELRGLDDSFLDLSQYTIRQRRDCYYLLPDSEFNIKMRRDQLLYKPLLKKANNARAFGKKINLLEQDKKTFLPGMKQHQVDNLLNLLNDCGQQIEVNKVALLHKLNTIPKTSIELARLQIKKQVFFTACIEGKALTLVESLSKHLLGNELSCDYITFLKKLAIHD